MKKSTIAKIEESMLDNNKPIYVWRLYQDERKIEKVIVRKYEERQYLRGKVYSYMRMHNGVESICHIRESDLDAFKNGKYCSFNEDDEAVVKAIIKSAENRIKKANEEITKANSLILAAKESCIVSE